MSHQIIHQRKSKKGKVFVAGSKVVVPKSRRIVMPKTSDKEFSVVKLNPRVQQHIVCFSGGKDSSAMLLRMIELKMPIDRILFCDTGKEFPQLIEYVKRMNDYTTRTIGVPVETLRADKTWDDMFFGKIGASRGGPRFDKAGNPRASNEGKLRGWPLMGFGCWWSRDSKVKLMDPICKGNIRYMGFGADEKKRLENDKDKVGYTFPLADWGWSEEDARQYLIDNGWAEQYHLDFNRTGCFFCPKQRADSLRTLCKLYPEQWDELMRYATEAQKPEFASHTFTPAITFDKLKQIERECKT